MVKSLKPIFFLFTLLLAMQIPGGAQPFAAQDTLQLRAELDRTSIAENESVGLKVILEGGREQSSPDFSILDKDFSIISQKNGTSMQVMNGDIRQSTTWSLTLIPKRSGSLSIPAFQVKAGKDMLRSRPLTLQVSPVGTASGSGSRTLSTSQDFFVQVSAEPETPYVHSQVIYTVQVYIGQRVAQASLTEPVADHASLSQLGDDIQYLRKKDGRQYKVFERRYVLFPEQPGTIIISPVRFDARLENSSSLFAYPFSSGGAMKSVRSTSLRLEVQPPVQPDAGLWLPADKVRLQASWAGANHKVKVGDPVTLTLNLEAEGQLSARLPEPELEHTQGIRMYPDQAARTDRPGNNGITGSLEKRIALIFNSPGTYTLPEISVPWWNVQTGAPEVARLENLSVTVMPSQEDVIQPLTPEEKTNIKVTVPDATASTDKVARREPGRSAPLVEQAALVLWQGLTAFFAFCWLVTTLLWLFFGLRSKQKNTLSSSTELKPAVTQKDVFNKTEQQLRQACLSHESDKAIQALHRLLPGNTGHQVSIDLQHAMDELYRSRYAPSAEETVEGGSVTPWNGEALWTAWQEFKTLQLRQGSRDNKEVLKPLW